MTNLGPSRRFSLRSEPDVGLDVKRLPSFA